MTKGSRNGYPFLFIDEATNPATSPAPLQPYGRNKHAHQRKGLYLHLFPVFLWLSIVKNDTLRPYLYHNFVNI